MSKEIPGRVIHFLLTPCQRNPYFYNTVTQLYLGYDPVIQLSMDFYIDKFVYRVFPR